MSFNVTSIRHYMWMYIMYCGWTIISFLIKELYNFLFVFLSKTHPEFTKNCFIYIYIN